MCSPAVWTAGSCRRRCRSDLALDALETGIGTREHAGHDVCGLRHHSDKGVQDVAVRCTQRLAEAGAFNSVYTAALVRNRGPWTGIDELEVATAEYIDWFNHRRLHGEIGMIPPVELDHHHQTVPAAADAALASL